MGKLQLPSLNNPDGPLSAGSAQGSSKAQAEVTAVQDECTRDLAVAEPVIIEAEAALNSLDKASLGELKSFGSPAADVVAVVSACMILTAAGGKIPKASLLSSLADSKNATMASACFFAIHISPGCISLILVLQRKCFAVNVLCYLSSWIFQI